MSVVCEEKSKSPFQEKKRWYKYPEFPLVPLLIMRPKDEHNTGGFTFTWIFFKFWTLDAANFEVSVVADTHWGIGVIGILPYLRWVIAIPCPYKVGLIWDKWTRRKTEYDRKSGLYGICDN